MSNNGVSTGFAKFFILCMAVVILVQGLAYLGLSVWGLTLSECAKEAQKDISSDPFKFVVDLIYFLKEECGAPSITVPDLNDTVEITINWSQSYTITNRFNIFLITYATVSGLWVVTSLMVITTICGRVTKLISAVCFWPWFIAVSTGSILDAVATGYHVNDILRTESAADFFDYVGLTGNADVMSALKPYDPYFVTPAIIMTCLSSRVAIVWLLNIFGTSFCLSLSKVLARGKKPSSNIFAASTAPASPASPAPRTLTPGQPLSEQQQQQSQYADYPPQIKPKPLAIQVLPPLPVQQNLQSPPTDNQPGAPANNLITYRSTDSHPDRLDYPAQPSTDKRLPSPELSAVSPLNTRYSGVETFAYPNQPQRVSAELRSQLPWSYTSALGGKPQPPRKPVQQQQMQMYPEIPEPDYATSNARPTTSGGATNTQQDQQYSRW